MKKKIKVIVKRPDEQYGHVTHISNTLENLQKTVGGYIETVTIGDIVIICDEEGRIKGKERNCAIPPTFSLFPTTFYGTIVVVGADGDEFTDVDITLDQWKRFYLGVN